MTETPGAGAVRLLARELEEPGETRGRVLRALLEAHGDRAEAARRLGLVPADLEVLLAGLGLAELVAERWPTGEENGP